VVWLPNVDITELAEAGTGLVKSLAETNPKGEVKEEGILEEALDTLDGIADKAEKLTKEGIGRLGGLAGGFTGISSLFGGQTQAPRQTFANRTAALVYEAGQQERTFSHPYDENDTAKKERYLKFKENFDQIAYAGKIARLLDEQPIIREIQLKLSIFD
jgi:hypothetical protein